MKKILSAVALLTLGLAVPAAAADLPARTYSKAPAMVPPPVYNWGGFYIGANGGGASSHKCWDFTTPAGAFIVSEGCHDATGGVAGGQVGYRWQMSNFVFGVEAQGDWADLRGSNQSLAFGAFTNNSKVDAIGLFTGQVGYAWNNVLFYVKGGGAVTDNVYNGLITGSNAVIDSARETRWGGAVGAGLEVGFAPNWSVGVEYDHLFMGNRSLNFTNPAITVFTRADNIRQDVDIGTVRVNYRWGGPVIAKY